MIPTTRALFNDKILTEGLRRWGVAPDAATELGGFESFVYEFERDGSSYVMKLGHSERRTADYIMGELDFVNYLARGGVSIPKAVASVQGNFTEEVPAEDGSYFVVYVFEKAPGTFLTIERMTDSVCREWGRVLGRMHRLANDYALPNEKWQRMYWYEDEDIDVRNHVPADQELVWRRNAEVISYIKSLPAERGTFGLVHEDLHRGNFYVHRGVIYPFDFDDCQYHYYASDLAMPLFYSYVNFKSTRKEREEIVAWIWPLLWEGYCEEHALDPFWVSQFPYFFKLREHILYGLMYREGEENHDDWCRRFLEGRRESIETNAPFMDVEFRI